MAEIETLETEVEEIFNHISNGDNFVLNGGAGSGKTYSLVHVIKKAVRDNPNTKIACITYTNAAVKNIEERFSHKNLLVSTIHDFLWDHIKNFQDELKKGLIDLMSGDEPKIKKPEGMDDVSALYDDLEGGIQYKEYLRIKEGKISHDEVITIAHHLFDKYDILCSILKDKYGFIFIDEYQDTHPDVVEILLTFFKKSDKKNIVGFFGDQMQSIYDNVVGDQFEDYVVSGDVKRVIKSQNRRNPQSVIDLANLIRTDGILQEPSTDLNAPNMQDGIVKGGQITFLYSDRDDIENIITELSTTVFSGWDFDNTSQTKLLNLTHRLIASKADFKGLYEIYDSDPIVKLRQEIRNKCKAREYDLDEEKSFQDVVEEIDGEFPKQSRFKSRNELLKEAKETIGETLFNEYAVKSFSEIRKIFLSKDSLIDDKKQSKEEESKKGSKRDNLIKHLFMIQNNIQLYKEGRYNEFIRNTSFQIRYGSDKLKLKEIIESIGNVEENSIEEVIQLAHEKGICIKGDQFNDFVENNPYTYERVKTVKYQEFINLYKYLEGYTPFSTQHKTKGAEFDNVLVVLDNGNWRDFNFTALFTGTSNSQNVLSRTQKLFYVCCTRAKENLVVYFPSPDALILNRAKEWFGEKNVMGI